MSSPFLMTLTAGIVGLSLLVSGFMSFICALYVTFMLIKPDTSIRPYAILLTISYGVIILTIILRDKISTTKQNISFLVCLLVFYVCTALMYKERNDNNFNKDQIGYISVLFISYNIMIISLIIFAFIIKNKSDRF
jgi:hypothetical protein